MLGDRQLQGFIEINMKGRLSSRVLSLLQIVSFFLALFTSLYSPQISLLLSFLSHFLSYPQYREVRTYLFSLASLLFILASGRFYLEIITPLLESMRVESEVYASCIAGFCGIAIVIHWYNKNENSVYCDLEEVFSCVGMTCVCVLQVGFLCGIATGLCLHQAKVWIICAKVRDKYRFYVRWGMPLLGFPLIGSVYYGLYIHYACFAALSLCAILVEILNFSYNYQENSFMLRNFHYYDSLPSSLRTLAFHWILYRFKNTRSQSLPVDLLLTYSEVLSGLSRASCDYIQECILLRPNFRLLGKMYKYRHHHLIRTSFLLQLRESFPRPMKQTVRTPSYPRLREMLTFPRLELIEVTFMRELLEGAESKLMLLWLIGKRTVTGTGRLPGVLLQEIVAYI